VTHPDPSPATRGLTPAEVLCPGHRIESRHRLAKPTTRPDEPGRVIRDCLHPRVHHEHGTRTAYVLDRCRCSPCTGANRAEARRRRKAIAYGRWAPLVSAEAARQHVLHLRRLGLSLMRIARLSGVGYGTVARLVYGDPSRQHSPTARVRHETQQRLLNVRTDVNCPPAGCRVAAAGSRRRVQSLVAAGWPLPTVAQRLGRRPGSLRRTLTANTVTSASARRITTLYDVLRDKPPPNSTAIERAKATRARTEGAQCGWLPPWAWDDIDNDNDDQDHGSGQGGEGGEGGEGASWLDEVAIARAMQGDSVRLTHAERDEAIARLTYRGVSARQIAALLETSSRNVVRRRAARRTV
jgi:hypothetical protein